MKCIGFPINWTTIPDPELNREAFQQFKRDAKKQGITHFPLPSPDMVAEWRNWTCTFNPEIIT